MLYGRNTSISYIYKLLLLLSLFQPLGEFPVEERDYKIGIKRKQKHKMEVQK